MRYLIPEDKQRRSAIALVAMMALLLILPAGSILAQEEFVPGAGGFLDEDGDGFNDLLPDTDGDGIPDALDPDAKGHKADSIYMHERNERQYQNTWQHMNQYDNQMEHGEPGMFGPGDSTMHGGMHDDGGGGGHRGGGGGMGPDGGGSPPDDGGGMDPGGGGMGPDGGMDPDGGSGRGGQDDPGGGDDDEGHGGPGGG